MKNRNTLPFLLHAHFIVLRRLLVLVQAGVEPIANLFYPSSVICMQGGLPDRMCMIENLSKSLHTNDLIHNEDIKLHHSNYNAFKEYSKLLFLIFFLVFVLSLHPQTSGGDIYSTLTLILILTLQTLSFRIGSV